jgi:hypothetical protein
MYDINNDRWSEIRNLTSDSKFNIGVDSISFTVNSVRKLMAIYNADNDGDLVHTQTDRAYYYSIYDGVLWTTPVSTSFYGGLGETSLAFYNDVIFYDFLSAPKNNTGMWFYILPTAKKLLSVILTYF